MFKNRNWWKVLLICVFVFPFLLGSKCPGLAGDPASVNKIPTTRGVVDYGNGVYYFPYIMSEFGNALSGFLAEHKGLEVIAMASDGTADSGSNRGYFVVFKEK